MSGTDPIYYNILLLQKIIESIPARVFWKDINLRYLGCNTRFARDAGFSHPDEVIGKDDYQMGWKEQAELYRADDMQVIKSGEATIDYEEPQTTPDGRTIWLRTSKVPLRDPADKIIGVLGIYDDITASKQAEEEIRRLASFPELNPAPVIELNTSREICFLNPAAQRTFPDLVNKGSDHSILRKAVQLLSTMEKSQDSRALDYEEEVGDKTYELHMSIVPEFKAIRMYVHDISMRKYQEEKVYRLATTDSLTGCLNRRAFLDGLQKEISRSRRYETPMSLIMFDIDYFKQVNDSHGHDVGDKVLTKLSELVRKNIRETDTLGRWGGEEFMIMAPQLELEDAVVLSEKLRSLVSEHEFGKAGNITISLGLTVLTDKDDIDKLSRRVDSALYRAKKGGRNRVEVLEGEG